MTSEVRSGTGGNNFSASYTYDDNGNRATKTIGGVTDTYSYDSHDKLTAISRGGSNIKTYGYDNNGNCTSVTVVSGNLTTSLSYDYENRITQITYPNSSTNTFAYNGLGLRTQKVDSAGTFNYVCDGTSPASAVLKDSAAVYTPGLSERRSSTSKFLHPDALGTTRGITNSSQTATDGLLFDAFGMSVSRTGSTPTPFGFVGGAQYQTDADSGLMLLGHRYYDCSIGRFITQDPARDEDNWYAYCGNNPLTRIDPTGEFFWLFAIGAAIDIGVQHWIQGTPWNQINYKQAFVSGVTTVASGGLSKLTSELPAVSQAVVNGIGNAGLGAGGQMVNNALNGDPIMQGVGKAAALNGGFSALGSLTGSALSGGKSSATLGQANLVLGGSIQGLTKPGNLSVFGKLVAGLFPNAISNVAPNVVGALGTSPTGSGSPGTGVANGSLYPGISKLFPNNDPRGVANIFIR